jgi:hypothetical protein
MLVLACRGLTPARAQAVTLVLARRKLIPTRAQAVMLVLACRGLTSMPVESGLYQFFISSFGSP